MHQKTQNHFLKFSIHLSVRKSGENYRQIYGKSEAILWRNCKHRYASKIFQDNPLLCSFSLQSTFFQSSRLTEIIRLQILIQTLLFLSRLPTRQDAVENHDKVYNTGVQDPLCVHAPNGWRFFCSPVTHAPIKEIVVSSPVVLYSIELEEEATLVMFNLIQP